MNSLCYIVKEDELDKNAKHTYARSFCSEGKILTYNYFDENCSNLFMIMIHYPICQKNLFRDKYQYLKKTCKILPPENG